MLFVMGLAQDIHVSAFSLCVLLKLNQHLQRDTSLFSRRCYCCGTLSVSRTPDLSLLLETSHRVQFTVVGAAQKYYEILHPGGPLKNGLFTGCCRSGFGQQILQITRQPAFSPATRPTCPPPTPTFLPLGGESASNAQTTRTPCSGVPCVSRVSVCCDLRDR